MPSDPVISRGAALIGLGVCIAILGTAAWMTPDPRGHGSHEQLGLPPCGMVATWGLPCPTCGMCTSFSLAIRGRFLTAFVTQPAGLVIFLVVIAACMECAHWVWRKQSLFQRRLVWSPSGWVLLAVGVLLAGWVYKIAVWSRT